jgi:lysozyme
MSVMRLSNEGKRLLEDLEGRRHTAYQDTAGKWTIGIGHLIQPSEGWMKAATLTDAQVDALFDNDIKAHEDATRRLFPRIGKQNQFDALVSFVYNMGEGAVTNGTLDDLINGNAPAEAIASKWKEYIYSGGKPTQGLQNRRTKELALFFAHLWRLAALFIVFAALLLAGAGTIILKA